MMASRKAVLDKNKRQLLDSVNASNKIYTNEELSILLVEQQKKIDELTKENTTLKTSVTGLNESIAAISNPKQPIKATVFDVYDGHYTGGMYSTLITINPYGSGSDFSGGYPTQFAITNGIIYKRHSESTTSWGAWTTLHS